MDLATWESYVRKSKRLSFPPRIMAQSARHGSEMGKVGCPFASFSARAYLLGSGWLF